MVELSSRAHALNLGSAAALGSAGTIGSASSSAGDSFTQELETAIQGILSQSGNGSQFEIDIQSGQSASGGNDYTITVKNLGSGAANSAASGSSSSGAVSSAPATGSGAGATSALSALMPSPASASSASAATTAAAIVGSAGSKPAAIINVPAPTSSTSTTGSTSATSPLASLMPSPAGTTPNIYTPPSSTSSSSTPTVNKSQMTPDQAYWAEQPPAVQALQNMDPADRMAAAQQLAQQGYTIDVPIMAWGWDPLTTMVERQNYGYTWVPSALQSPVPLPPGLSFPGLPNYDPNNPPAGSIKVTTDFAAGTNMQDVFVDPATIEASMSPAAQAQSQNSSTVQSPI